MLWATIAAAIRDDCIPLPLIDREAAGETNSLTLWVLQGVSLMLSYLCDRLITESTQDSH